MNDLICFQGFFHQEEYDEEDLSLFGGGRVRFKGGGGIVLFDKFVYVSIHF